MRSVDFFAPQWYAEHTSERLFFIYDKEDGSCAKLSTNEADQSTSVNVHNPSVKDILFLPVDHNLNIRKEGLDDLDSTCDYLLTVNEKEHLIFGAIKTGRKGWASEGMKQVKHTVEVFRAYHDIAHWNNCRAYVSNWRKWNARTSTRCVEEAFKAETGGLRLYIKNDVNIDGE